MMWRHERRREGRAFMGVVFLVIGTLLLLGNLNFINTRFLFSHWWPLILVVIGIKQLLILRGPGAWIAGLFWAGTGALFLASTLGYIHVAITSVLWPLMLIWFGVLIVVGHHGCGRNSIEDGSKM